MGLKKDLKRLYAGDWTEREVKEQSFEVNFGKALPLPPGKRRDKVIRNLENNAWKSYKTYSKVVKKLPKRKVTVKV